MIFDRFAPFIRDYIYSRGWQELREVQKEAAEVIFDSEDNLLICSSTASGKTEAAFFPIISLLCNEPPTSDGFSVLYIAPLKSLINDQFERMTDILRMSEIPLTHWHGDVGASHKSKALKSPRGILQITPESLESMLINRGNDIPKLFTALKFVVIDELHSIMGSDRGRQILCQLTRLERIIASHPRRIGLSATIGDKSSAASWLGDGSGHDTVVVSSDGEKTRKLIAINHFFIHNRSFNQSGMVQDEHSVTAIRNPEESEINNNCDDNDEKIVFASDGILLPQTNDKKAETDPGYEYIYDCCKGKKCLVFSNSREETEYTTATLRQIAARRNESDVFLIHHGNISAALREDAEDKLKHGDIKYTVCATVTLELGIDIGNLERVVELDSPIRVSDFLQRIGRSGRRSAPSEMITVIREEESLPNAPLPQTIPWALARAIAIIRLYKEEGFIEPASTRKMPLSLLFQQILSLLASTGELSASCLASRIYSMPPFSDFPRDIFKSLLKFMIDENYLQKTEEGGIIIGLKGERITNSFKFYASFKDSEDYTVRCGSEEIGTISACPPVGERFALAGKAWEIEDTDLERRLIYVKPIQGKLEVSWPGEYGEIHTKLLEYMHLVLCEQKNYSFLRPNAQKRLNEGVSLALNTHMDKQCLVSLGGNSYCLFPWLGTRSFNALLRIIKKYAPHLGIAGIENGTYYITFKMNGANLYNFAPRLLKLIENDGGIDPVSLVGTTEIPIYDKYDHLLPHELLQYCYAHDKLNVSEALLRLNQIAQSRFPRFSRFS